MDVNVTHEELVAMIRKASKAQFGPMSRKSTN